MKKHKCAILLSFAICHLASLQLSFIHEMRIKRGKAKLARIFHELVSRDHEDGCATWQPQGVGSEAYLNGTSQGPTPEDAREDGHIRSRSK
jgi:hypothetical protein